MINFDNLQEVSQVNSRVEYDLRFSATTGRFTLSEDAYDRLEISKNGFSLFSDGKTPVLAVMNNEDAAFHKGREGAAQKGRTFTAVRLATMLGLEKEDVTFTFNEVENNGNKYLLLEKLDKEVEATDLDENVSVEEDALSITNSFSGE